MAPRGTSYTATGTATASAAAVTQAKTGNRSSAIWRAVTAMAAVSVLGLGTTGISRADASPAVQAPAACPSTLTAWCAALAGSGSTPANVLVVGDSVAEGYWAPDRADSWVNLVRARLQLDGGGSGMGYLPVTDALPSTPAFPDLWNYGGGTISSQGLGDRSYTINSAAGFASATVPADRFQLSYTTSPTGGAMRILIDGQQAARVDTYNALATTSGRTWLSAPLSPGSHMITVVADNTGHLPVYSVVVEGVMVFNGDDTSGVHIWDSSHSGYTATNFLIQDSANLPSDIAQANPDLVIIELGTNDMTDQVLPSAFEANLASIISTVTANDSHVPSVLLMPMWDATSHDAATYQQYVAAEQDLARKQGLSLADLSGVDPTIYTADGTHPNTAGGQIAADTVLRTIDPTYATQVTAPTGPVTNPLNLPRQTIPGVPQSVAAAAGSAAGAIAVTWAPPADGSGPMDWYAVQATDVSTTPPTMIPLEETGGNTATVPGLTAGHPYTVQVTAENTAGNSPPSAAVAVSLPGPPTPPINVIATAATTAGTASVTWTPSSFGSPDSYVVQAFDMTGGTYVTQQVVTSPSATFTGLTSGHGYAFLVYAHNSYGYESPGTGSNTVTVANVTGPPTAPTKVTATGGNGQATVTWTAPASNGGSAITSYTVTASGGKTAVATGSATSAVVTGLTNGTAFTFTVTATNASGTGVASAPSNAVTPVAGPPTAPTNVTATAGKTAGTVSVTWTPSSSGSPDSYLVQAFDMTAGTFVGQQVVTSTGATVSGLKSGHGYAFTIYAHNSYGYCWPGASSNTVTAR